MVAGCAKPEFPSETDRLILSVAANQAAVVLQQRRSQEELHRREHQLADFFDNAAVGLHWVGPDGTILRANRAELELLGYSAEEYIGHHIAAFHADESVICDILSRLQKGEELRDYEARLKCKDGSIKHVLINSNVLWEDEKFIHTRCITRDVTDLKQAEAQLRKSQEEFRNLLRLLPVGVYTCEAPSGRLTYWNEHAAKLWGREPNTGENPDRYCGSHKLYTLDGSLLPHEQCPMGVAIREGRAFRNVEVEIERPDGSRFTALVSIDPIRNDVGQVVGAINVFQDVSSLKQAEVKLKEADRRKDEFLATLAHELRNPLAPIRNSLHVLRMAGQNPAAAARVHQMMERQMAHLVRLVDDLLEISRISRGKIELKKELHAISAIIQHALETSKPFVESGKHTLNVSVPEAPIFLEGDAVRLSQVVSNLLNNAAKYMETGGSITLSAQVEGENVVISVRDTGIGIPREMLSRVFEMFVQVENPLRRTQDGLGIGLSLVQTLVSMHGGTVEARSDGIGRGSEFIVRLPVAKIQRSEDNARPVPQSKVDPAVCRILVVDDNKDSAESLGMMLNFLGADVQVVYDGKTALESINTLRPTIIFMDLGMPGMDGCEVARDIRKRPENNEIRLIALTGWGQEEDRRRSRAAGFDQHLVKPIDFDALQAVLALHTRVNAQ